MFKYAILKNFFEESSQRGKRELTLYWGSFHYETAWKATWGAGSDLGPLLTWHSHPLSLSQPSGAQILGHNNKAKGWKLERAGADSTHLLSFSLGRPQLVWLWKKWQGRKSKNSCWLAYRLVIAKATRWVKIPAEEEFSPELGRGWFLGKGPQNSEKPGQWAEGWELSSVPPSAVQRGCMLRGTPSPPLQPSGVMTPDVPATGALEWVRALRADGCWYVNRGLGRADRTHWES